MNLKHLLAAAASLFLACTVVFSQDDRNPIITASMNNLEYSDNLDENGKFSTQSIATNPQARVLARLSTRSRPLSWWANLPRRSKATRALSERP